MSDVKLKRCLRLLDAFQSRGELATRDVMQLCDTDRQTAARDLRSLQDAEVPIETVGEGTARRYRLDPGWRRARLRITVGDVLALQFGRQMLDFLEGTQVAGWLDELRDKLAPAFTPSTNEQASRLQQRLVYLSEPYRHYAESDESIGELLTALLQDREIRVRHQALGGERTYERLQPYTLVIYRRALYLLANDPEAGILRRLAVDRIQEVDRLPTTFRLPHGFDARRELEASFGIEASGEPERVVLRFDPRVAPLVSSRAWHPTQRIVDLPGGGVELRMRTFGRELVRFALEFGDHVEVVEPAWLREAVIRELEGALARYREGEAALAGEG